mmetsp:Transcript_47571/g.119768  ORF Transcript_47571/g.119768 Transcript_47571/m.119768 type:complete len:264 (+) Transcript_47571:839-1630(+)
MQAAWSNSSSTSGCASSWLNAWIVCTRRAASSGQQVTGMLACLRMEAPSAMHGPPVYATYSGLVTPSASAFALTSATSRAIPVGSVIACGVTINKMQSLSGSLRVWCSVVAKISGVASPRMSIGLAWLQFGDRKEFSLSISCAPGCTSSPPCDTNSSAASTPGPPALVTISRRLPLGSGCMVKNSVRLKRSSTSCTLCSPAFSITALNTSSRPVRVPVWEAAAAEAAAVRPAFTITIGFFFAATCAACTNFLTCLLSDPGDSM